MIFFLFQRQSTAVNICRYSHRMHICPQSIFCKSFTGAFRFIILDATKSTLNHIGSILIFFLSLSDGKPLWLVTSVSVRSIFVSFWANWSKNRLDCGKTWETILGHVDFVHVQQMPTGWGGYIHIYLCIKYLWTFFFKKFETRRNGTCTVFRSYPL